MTGHVLKHMAVEVIGGLGHNLLAQKLTAWIHEHLFPSGRGQHVMQMVSLQEPATGIIDSEWFMHQASCVSAIGPRLLVLILKKKGQKLFLNHLGSLCMFTSRQQLSKFLNG